MYREPIKIFSDDILCNATSLEGTVIGILFEKSGEEIQSAANARLNSIEGELAKIVSKIVPITRFLKSKDALLAEIEDFETKREDLCTDQTRSIVEQLDKLHLDLKNKKTKIRAETHDKLEIKRVEFDKGWDGFEEEIKDIVKEEKEKKWETANTSISGLISTDSCSTSSVGVSNATFCSSTFTPVNWDLQITISDDLHERIQNYRKYFNSLKDRIEVLESEKRKLSMILRNITADRKYKLTLAQLSAFGFEDIVVKSEK